MGRFYHDEVVYRGVEDEGRSAAGSRVKGGSEAARRKMLDRDVRHKKQVERDRARAERAKVQKEEQKERARLDTWARNTGLYSDFSDYEKHRREGRQGYAD